LEEAVIILLGDTRSKTALKFMREHGWGRMFATARPTPQRYEPWGFDNGAFDAWKKHKPFPEGKFLRRLDVALKVPKFWPFFEGNPLLAVCPDIVAGGLRSLDFSLRWLEKLPVYWPWYLAVQDGMSEKDVSKVLHLFHGIFLGGTDKFKLTAYRWSLLAHSFDKRFHYGRAGTLRKIRHAWKVEADSVDSNFPLWTVKRLSIFRDEWKALQREEQPSLCLSADKTSTLGAVGDMNTENAKVSVYYAKD
jgi:hypothetical protein